MAVRARKAGPVSGPIGFIGVGRMGTPMVKHLLRAGHSVLAWDRDARARERARAAGAQTAGSVAEIAASCRVVMVCLPTPQVVREVALGDAGLASGQAVKIYVDLSTCGSETSRDVAAALQERGIVAVDSPVTGGVPRVGFRSRSTARTSILRWPRPSVWASINGWAAPPPSFTTMHATAAAPRKTSQPSFGISRRWRACR